MRTVLANLAGLFVLAMELILFLALPLCRSISLPIGYLGYFVLAGCALYVWHSTKLPTSTPAGWLGLAAATIVGGSISFVIDAFIGSSVTHGPVHSFLDAAEHAGEPFRLSSYHSALSVFDDDCRCGLRSVTHPSNARSGSLTY